MKDFRTLCTGVANRINPSGGVYCNYVTEVRVLFSGNYVPRYPKHFSGKRLCKSQKLRLKVDKNSLVLHL